MMQLAPYQCDVLQEIINIGVGRAAGMLNAMIRSHVSLRVPELHVFLPEQVRSYLAQVQDENLAMVRLPFSGIFQGFSALLFPSEDAVRLANALLAGQGFTPGSGEEGEILRREALQEVGNVVLNGVMGSLGNLLAESVEFAPPEYCEERAESMFADEAWKDTRILLARTTITLEEHYVHGEILILFTMDSFGALLAAIDRLMPPDARLG